MLRYVSIGAFTLATLCAQTPSAEEIMRRVAANQDRAQELRSAYVYQQKVRIRTLNSHSKVMHEETSQYTVLPGPSGTKKELVTITGRHFSKGKYVSYDQKSKDASAIDTSIVQALRKGLVEDPDSRDGLNRKLFPLTTSEIARYSFERKGEENWRGMKAYRITFTPKPTHEFTIDTEEGPWSGEALIHADEFEPITVSTKLAHGIPRAVQVLLGSNVRGLGFSVSYQKVDGGVWFPSSYGTEFSVRALFVWARNITVSLDNSGFQKASVNSTVQFDDVK